MPLSPCRLRILHVALHVHPMRTRFPFRYGIASMTSVPHLFVQVQVEVDGVTSAGLSSEGLPPKWFTKNPQSSMEQDLAEMIAVIQHAVKIGLRHNDSPRTFFDLWKLGYREQGQWASTHGYPPLLWNFGLSLVERAVLDALCKHHKLPLHALVKTPLLGIRWAEVHPELAQANTSEFLPAAPLATVSARHTVGLADPLLTSDIPVGERLDDGLPQVLDECIPAYGLRYFKIKLSGDLAVDQARLRTMAEVLQHRCGDDWQATLDGNEQFHDMEAFHGYFNALREDAELAPILERTLWVEQPMHRDRALDESVGRVLATWPDAPPLIIDESDGSLGDAHRALQLGYSGTSHKNCKGVLKGLANAAFIHEQRRRQPGKSLVISGEDLVNVGPVALLQDLAVQALLGVTHVERNGHHYFRGLSMYPEAIAEEATQKHSDLYGTRADGLTALRIEDGKLSLGSINSAPFGTLVEPDLSQFPNLKDWILQGGLTEIGRG